MNPKVRLGILPLTLFLQYKCPVHINTIFPQNKYIRQCRRHVISRTILTQSFYHIVYFSDGVYKKYLLILMPIRFCIEVSKKDVRLPIYKETLQWTFHQWRIFVSFCCVLYKIPYSLNVFLLAYLLPDSQYPRGNVEKHVSR